MPDPDDRVASTLSGWRKIEQAATPGPWTVSEKHGVDIADEAWSEVKLTAADGSDVAALYISHLMENYNSDEDRAFITTARTAFPRLVAAVEAVLNLADEWKTDAAATAERVASHAARGDGHAAAFASGSAETLTDCARTLRAAIAAALTGDDRDHG